MKNFNKLNRFALVLALLGTVLFTACRPDSVEPRPSDEIAAFLSEDEIHEPLDPICGVPFVTNLVSSQWGPAYPLGNVQVMNGTELFAVEASANPGMVITESALWHGPKGMNPPVDGNGIVDRKQFQNQVIPTVPKQKMSFRVELAEMDDINNICVWVNVAMLDPNGTPMFSAPCWGWGVATPTGGSVITYQNQLCPSMSCQPWNNGANPCNPPCAVPTAGPGDDLSDYACGNPKANKVTVCHLPPGNPANMQEICISVNALPAHIIDFKPANNPCMGHHSGCHLGPCDPCGPGTTADYAADQDSNCPGN